MLASFYIFYFRCISAEDDPYKSCFGCDQSNFESFYNHIDRQTGEMFQSTSQSRRVICGAGTSGRRRCRLRIDKAMQFRRITYGRAIQFIQSEQYLSDEDMEFL